MTDKTLAVVDDDDYSQANIDLVKKTYARDLSDQEFALVIAEGKHRGLSALNKEIIGLKFRGVMSTMVTLSGARKLAHQSGRVVGIEGPFWCSPDRKWLEFWDSADPPVAAKFSVWIDGYKVPVVGVATWKERKQTYVKDGKTNLMPTWAAMPALMLGKVAETDAYKRAGLLAEREEVYYEGDEGNVAPRTISVRDEAKQSAMKHVHQIGHAQGVDHEGVRDVVRAIRPGVQSLTDPDVTTSDLNAAADVIDAFGVDAAETVSADADVAPVVGDGDEPSPQEIWRNLVKEAYTDWNRQTATDISQMVKSNATELWRWNDLIEFAPTAILRDKMADAAHKAGMTDAAIDAANARRKDGTQIKRAAQAAANPIPPSNGTLLEADAAPADYRHLTE